MNSSSTCRWSSAAPLLVTVVLLLTFTADGRAAPEDIPAPRRCISVLNRSGAHLIRATGQLVRGCVERAFAGDLPSRQTVSDCLEADADGLVAQVRGEADTRARCV